MAIAVQEAFWQCQESIRFLSDLSWLTLKKCLNTEMLKIAKESRLDSMRTLIWKSFLSRHGEQIIHFWKRLGYTGFGLGGSLACGCWSSGWRQRRNPLLNGRKFWFHLLWRTELWGQLPWFETANCRFVGLCCMNGRHSEWYESLKAGSGVVLKTIVSLQEVLSSMKHFQCSKQPGGLRDGSCACCS